MQQDEENSLLEFPCEFPFKIMGKNCDEFQVAIVGIFNNHCQQLSEGAIKTRESSAGKYLSMTVTIQAQSREQLDNIYRELTAHELVVWTI